MKTKIIPFLLGAAVIAPLYLSTPAQAQSYEHIQNLEERIQDANQRGNYGYAQQLRRELNRERLQYQRRRGMGEVRQNPRYYDRYDRRNRGYYPRRQYNRGQSWFYD
jgi:hypothetical protein